MTHSPEGTEAYLRVGQSIIFYPEAHRQDGPRYEVAVRGWQKGSYILLEMTPVPTRGIVFRDASECSLRFLKDGVACSMNATIIDWQVSRKKPTFTVSWPTTVRTAAVRRNERVDVQIPCTIHFNDGQMKGSLQDLSVGGCGLHSTRSTERDSSLVVSMTLPDGVYIDRAPLVVRNVREIHDGRYYLGCMLDNAPPLVRTSIEFYVTTTLLRSRGIAGGPPIALFVDPEMSDGDDIVAALREHGYEVHVRSNLIDGVSFARLRLPAALLVRYEWQTATALDFCRVLHTSPAFEKMPLIVYGAPGDTHAALTAAGAEACHTARPGADDIIEQVRTHAGQHAEPHPQPTA